jgi:CBS domain-containing protein
LVDDDEAGGPMRCPYCDHDNIEGNDACVNCGRELMGDDIPGPTAGLQARLMTDPLDALRPSDPVSVPADATVADAIWVMRDRNVGCVIVMDRDSLAGIFTERDILTHVAGREDEALSKHVRELMSPCPETLNADDTVRFVFHKMAIGDLRHIPVARRGAIVGMVSARDVLEYLAAIFASPEPDATAVIEST